MNTITPTLGDLLALMRQGTVPHWTVKCLEQAQAEIERLRIVINAFERLYPLGLVGDRQTAR